MAFRFLTALSNDGHTEKDKLMEEHTNESRTHGWGGQMWAETDDGDSVDMISSYPSIPTSIVTTGDPE